jgi:hypothetical protein
MPQRLPVLVETNRVIREFAEGTAGADVRWQFLCECGCYQLVELTLAEFDAADAVVQGGHRLPDGSPRQLVH